MCQMEYYNLAKRLDAIRSELITLRDKQANSIKEKINLLKEINDLLKEQNKLLMLRQKVLSEDQLVSFQ